VIAIGSFIRLAFEGVRAPHARDGWNVPIRWNAQILGPSKASEHIIRIGGIEEFQSNPSNFTNGMPRNVSSISRARLCGTGKKKNRLRPQG
jgi:hypothetical protein